MTDLRAKNSESLIKSYMTEIRAVFLTAVIANLTYVMVSLITVIVSLEFVIYFLVFVIITGS